MNRRQKIAAIVAATQGGVEYYQTIKSTFGASLQHYWPIWDTSGAVAVDMAGNGNGVISNVTLDQPGFNRASGLFVPASSSYIDIYAALNALFSRDEGALSMLVKMRDVSVWSDGATRCLFIAYRTGGDQLYITRVAGTNGRLQFHRASGATSQSLLVDNLAFADWFQVGCSWSVSQNKAYFTINGHKYGSTFANLQAWTAGGYLDPAKCIIGAGSKTTLFSDAYIQHVAMGNAYISEANMRAIGIDPILPVFFGDSITVGVGASDTAHSWVGLLQSASGRRIIRNSGISGTVLQNTVQNTVAAIGGAVTSNGQDTIAARVMAYNPDLCYILYGLNDLRLNDAAFTAAKFGTSLGLVVDAIVANGTPASSIIIGSPPRMVDYSASAPYNGGTVQKQSDYRDQCAAVATAKGTKYADVYQAMVDGGGDNLTGADGIHPNDAGHAVITAAFLSVA